MLLISSSNADGVVFVDTADLDGETNLKDKMEPMPGLSERKAIKFQGKVFCDKPNHMLEEWDGEISSDMLPKNVICDISNFLLRSTVLRNTKWVIGIAINLGK